MQVVPLEVFTELEELAKRHIPRDASDWPTVDLALTLPTDIWTLDPDFLGCGVATWTTDVLLTELQSEYNMTPR